MRHSVNIVVALLSMAAGAWTGTTAQTEQPGLLAEQGPRAESPSSVTLRGCLQKGQAAGTFLLVTPRALTEASAEAALPPAARPQDRASSDASTAVAATARTVSYELVAGKSDVDLASLVGKRVEVQGTPELTAPGATADDSPAAEAAAADTPSADRTTDGVSTSTSGSASGNSQRSRVRLSTIRPSAARAVERPGRYCSLHDSSPTLGCRPGPAFANGHIAPCADPLEES